MIEQVVILSLEDSKFITILYECQDTLVQEATTLVQAPRSSS